MIAKELKIHKGSVIVYRVFDAAQEIQLKRVEEILKSSGGESRIKLSPKSKDAVIIKDAPVRFQLGDIEAIKESPFERAELAATVYNYGTLSLAFQFPLKENTSWKELVEISSLLNSDHPAIAALDELAKRKAQEILKQLDPALIKPKLWDVVEDYYVYFLNEISGIEKAADLLDQATIAELLIGEKSEKLSDDAADNALQYVFQYGEQDLVAIDWNNALVVERTGQREILDVLEFALTQLLEVRYYDDLLDKRLEDLYDLIERKRTRIWRDYFSGVTREANSRYIEFTEFMERMDNSLKVVGDFYLARIFRGALRRFRISDWEASITRKINLLAKVSEILQGEINVRRGHILELTIIGLILFEIISAFWK